jgi:Rhodopirellula transposase DDE domain
MQLQQKYAALASFLDERQRRLWAGAEALVLGHGGVTTVAQATGLSRPTVAAGRDELQAFLDDPDSVPPAAVLRQPGAGRKPLTETDPTLLTDLERLVDPLSRGDPQSPLRWTCKSTAQLAATLGQQGHTISPRTVAQLLKDLGYSLQGTRKTLEGSSHPDRNAQFEHINAQAEAFQERGQPVISVDTKKKELLGSYQQKGREWQPSGQPEPVNTYDFPDPEVGKGIPYGVFDERQNVGWVSVGVDHDTARFAVETIRRWWLHMGQEAYPEATELLITADGGGSNSSRNRLWKVSLQELADELGLAISVCHFPPGTSKWNKIEHRLFNHISMNWRGRPLTSHEVMVELIGATTTQEGLRIEAALDQGEYPTGIKVSAEELAALNLERATFHGNWNYTIKPGVKTST